MSEHYEEHAIQVSQAFIELLPNQVQTMISEEHRNKLAMLVEAAISTAVFQELEQVADQVAGLSKRIRDDAERYDKD
jgi:hypothetical protein